MGVTIRTMSPTDVDGAADAVLRGGWGDRRSFFAFATSQPACRPLVAVADDEVVGTGVGTVNGSVGWVGTIFVAPERRGAGLGQALTEAVIARLEDAGCRSLVLVATDEGRRIYERLGFEVETSYHILEAVGLPTPVPGLSADARPPTIRAFSPADLDTMVALDRDATGEDREHLVRRFADPGSTRVAERDGLVVGSTIRASWGGGATIVASDDVGLALLDDRRVAHGPGGRVRIGLLEESGEAIERLLAAGLTTVRVVPRMVRGEPVAWHPRRIWGEFNFAVG